ncbi:MAG: hypothetical protein ACRBB0_11480 [Pelagimonas sp.]|uniref:hypothetical protein n=1 Tax=Pelagimonas sp. TaxID=2073170 RepID=UPI003D6A4573
MTQLSAKAIYQANLDHVSEAVWSRDWDELVNQFVFPLVIRTLDTGSHITLPSQLVQTAQAFRDSLALASAQSYHRVCIEAQFSNPETTIIIGQHRTIALRGGSYVLPPFESDMRLELRTGQWLTGSLFARVNNHDLTVVSPELARFSKQDLDNDRFLDAQN